MARVIPDLDARDYTARDTVRAQLRTIREHLGMSQHDLGQLLGTDQANIRRLERGGVLQSRTGTVTRWARALRHELVLEPVGLPAPSRTRRPSTSYDVDEALALIVHAGQLTGDQWRAARIVSDLTGIRVAAGVTQDALADRIGRTVQAVSFMESSTADTAIVVLQRYARGVARCTRPGSPWRDGRLDVRLEPIVSGQRNTDDSCSVDTVELVRST